MVSFGELSNRLSPESIELLVRMVRLHLEAEQGDRSFLSAGAALGRHGTLLIFTSPNLQSQLEGVDQGALNDLLHWQLLSTTYSRKGTPSHRVSSDGLAFYRFLMKERGEPVKQTEEAVRTLVDSEAFAAAHPSAAVHLTQAFELLWKDSTTDLTVSEIGGHLRSAIQDTVFDLTKDRTNHEKPVAALKAYIGGAANRESRAVLALLDLVDAVNKLGQRVNHVRDEQGKGELPVSWKELRRACFLTAVACAELSTLE